MQKVIFFRYDCYVLGHYGSLNITIKKCSSIFDTHFNRKLTSDSVGQQLWDRPFDYVRLVPQILRLALSIAELSVGLL